MAKEQHERRFVDLLATAGLGRVSAKHRPPWLSRPGRTECGQHWKTIQAIYRTLEPTLELPDEMPPRERRTLDAVLHRPNGTPHIVEFDESQHFNQHRRATLNAYPRETPLGFPVDHWIDLCRDRTLSTTGGWGKAKPSLFPEPGGRHKQRAFRDALADLIPPLHGYGPTIRVALSEVQPWLNAPDARDRLTHLVASRL